MYFGRYCDCIGCGQELLGEKFSRVPLRASFFDNLRLLETFSGVETLTDAAEKECLKKIKNALSKWVLKKDENRTFDQRLLKGSL